MATAYIAHSCWKVLSTDAAGATSQIVLEGVRNSHESIQLVVNPDSNLTDVDVTVSSMAGPDGAVLAASAWTLYRVNYVDCESQGWIPDSMVPFINPNNQQRIGSQYGAPFAATSGQNYPIWMELYIPTGAKSGVYTGAASVTEGGVEQQSVPIQVTVHSATMPSTSTLTTYFNLKAITEQEQYFNALHDHRIDVWNIQGVTAHSYNEGTGQMDW